MAKYKLTKAEQETILLWDEEQRLVRVDAFDVKLKNTLEKAVKDYPDKVKCIGSDQHGCVAYELPRSLLTIKVKKRISEEKHRELSERGRKGYYASKAKVV